jgi:hypothetical protein
MMTQPTDVPVPPGAEPDQWIGGQRDVYSTVGHVATSRDLLKCPAVTVVAEQRQNGHLGAIDVHVDVDPMHSGMGVSQARELAALINVGADLADQWAGRAPSSADRLAALRAELHAAYTALRTAPGNVGDYLRAALDSLDDAIEVAAR